MIKVGDENKDEDEEFEDEDEDEDEDVSNVFQRVKDKWTPSATKKNKKNQKQETRKKEFLIWRKIESNKIDQVEKKLKDKKKSGKEKKLQNDFLWTGY